ncbi:MAG: hypothetical protein ACRD8W_10940, partial [Nitrososphaeraceae archaeon]
MQKTIDYSKTGIEMGAPGMNMNPATIEYLLLIINGYTSAYAIWSHIKKEAKSKGVNNVNLKVTSYNNVNKRISNLIDNGLLEEMKPTDDSVQHGRKDLKLTDLGFKYLIPYVIKHSDQETLRTVTEY